MPFIAIIIVVIFLSIVGIGINKSFSQVNEKEPVASGKVTDSSRSQLDKELGQVEKKVSPQEVQDAMCYAVTVEPEYQEYVCPIDGEKTVLDNGDPATREVAATIVEMRRLVARSNTITDMAGFALDEKRMCLKCSPNLKDNERYVSLVVTYPDKKMHVYERLTVEELRILSGFFEKKLARPAAPDEEILQQGDLGKAREMLGITK